MASLNNDITTSDISSFTVSARRRLLSETSSTISISYVVDCSSSSQCSQFQTYITTADFTSNLQTAATTYGATDLTTCTSVSVSAVVNNNSQSQSSSSGSSSKSMIIIIAAAAGGGGGLLVILLCLYLFCFGKSRVKNQDNDYEPDFEAIEKTNNSKDNKAE